MSDEYDEGAKQVKARMYPQTRRALDQLVEERDDWGNRSDALRGLIREAAEGTVATDGGPAEQSDEHVPGDPVLRAVYRAGLDAADRKLKIEPAMLSSVAQAVNNDTDVPVSPNTEAVEQMLRRLQSLGFAYKHTSANWDGSHITSRWRLKPPEAIPDEWVWNEENVEQRREERSQSRSLWQSPSKETVADD
ncbi:hypothetical protein [Halorarius litoreus]|uniref:hypothetical protein n=1 Tax=Halorarius litoreus TaxID=2962676 RepID=UPI0020CF83CF|nr:hypothetical protein [Halorarius litoreus]